MSVKNATTLAAVLLCAATSVFAVNPQTWTSTTADDFLAGETEGMAVTSRGDLRAAPRAEKIASVADPFVLSQVSTPDGARFLGTGNEGKVYRLDAGAQPRVIFKAAEPEIYALAFSGGSLYVASSPNGKIYRVDPKSGNSSVWFDPAEAYVWSLVPSSGGAMFVGTGLPGRLLRVGSDGKAETWFDATEPHVRSLAVAPSGKILAGGSGEGRIYEVTAKGQARSLFDSTLTEITAIWIDPSSGIGWATGATSVLPTTPPAPQQPAAQQQQQQQQQAAAADVGGEGAVEVSFSYDDGSGSTGAAPQAMSSSASGELYRIDTDGFVEAVRRFDREIVYAITGAGNGDIYLAAGPLGRIYRYDGAEIGLVATVPEKQVVSVDASGSVLTVTTTNSGAVYRLDPSRIMRAEFRSSVKDAERFSRFGHFNVEGRGIGGSGWNVAFRSGNTETPDTTWSDWKSVAGVEGAVPSPAARYLQWRITVDQPKADLAVDSVTVAYVNRNVAPVIDSVTAGAPGEVILSSAYPTAPQVVEATNPDENGIFTSITEATERSLPGKKYYRKGFRTLSWKARDANGDPLRYSVAFRPTGSDQWLRLRDNIDEQQMNFDTSQLPDGRYELKVVASDERANPETPLTSEKGGVEIVVDNTPPAVTSSREGNDFVVRITDRLSPVYRIEYSVDAKKWNRTAPSDGIADAREEIVRIPRSAAQGSFVMVRVLDSFYNVTTETIR